MSKKSWINSGIVLTAILANLFFSTIRDDKLPLPKYLGNKVNSADFCVGEDGIESKFYDFDGKIPGGPMVKSYLSENKGVIARVVETPGKTLGATNCFIDINDNGHLDALLIITKCPVKFGTEICGKEIMDPSHSRFYVPQQKYSSIRAEILIENIGKSLNGINYFKDISNNTWRSLFE